ncbi:MAG TPA: MFS transporter [Acidisarcina sp.]
MSERALVPNEPVLKLGPSALLLHCGMLATGLGMTLLGPILPLVMADWGLRDSQGGLLLTAQFVGMSLGSVSISRELHKSLMVGILAALTGFAGLTVLAWAHGTMAVVKLAGACSFLFVAGFGLGLLITSVNLIAGARFTAKRGSGLSLLNFSWSVGAVLSPLLASWLGRRLPLWALLGGMTSVLVLVGLKALQEYSLSTAVGCVPGTAMPDLSIIKGPPQIQSAKGISAKTFSYFGAIFFLYGGVEGCMNGWLATYTLRYGGLGLSISETCVFLFWVSLTMGRALASLLLLHLTESTLQSVALALATLVIGALIFAHSVTAISICSVVIGLGLAPCFPATLSLLVQRKPRPRQSAFALALTAVGGAALSWAMGAASVRTHSLKTALLLPLICSGILLVLCQSIGRAHQEDLVT